MNVRSLRQASKITIVFENGKSKIIYRVRKNILERIEAGLESSNTKYEGQISRMRVLNEDDGVIFCTKDDF